MAGVTTSGSSITVGPSRFMSHREKLGALFERIRDAERMEEILDEVKEELLALMHVERITIYERTTDGREIYSRYKTGSDIGEIRVPLSPTSIAGYVAMSQTAVRIDDVNDQEQLALVHPRLRFNSSYDAAGDLVTESMLAAPISFGDTVLGVLQLINKTGGARFEDYDLVMARQFAELLGRKFRYDRESTQGPYEYLIREGILTPHQLEEAEVRASERGRSVAFVLRSEYELSEEDIGQSLEQYFQVPFMGYDEDVVLPAELLETLNKPFLIRNVWVPIAGDRSRAVILIDNPNDAAKIMDIQRILMADTYEFMVGIEEDILNYLGVAPDDAQVQEIEAPQAGLAELVDKLEDETSGVREYDGHGGELVDENAATIIQLVNKLIADAVELNASDIHVEPSKGEGNGSVRMRVDGVCRRVLEIPASLIRYVVARIKIMAKVDIAETRLPQDGKIACKLYGKPLELRVATLPTVNGETVVMRILAAGDPLPFEKLNLTERNANVIKRMLEHPHGIILVVGPTGSGKTTTLHALLGRINTPERKILTAEDPVEITQPGLQQLQVRPGIGLDFARALRAFLRADPDVILIGEMRDYETAHSGIEASLTGHLVMSTLHTNSAPETITRLLDMNLDPLNFADALIGVVAQRLVRTLCPKCKEAYQPAGHDVEHLINAYGPEYFPELGIDESNLEIYRPKGCDYCAGTGYRGRTGVHEVLEATTRMKDLIVSRPGAHVVKDLATAEGMRTLMQDGVYKIFRGETDLRQVRAVTVI